MYLGRRACLSHNDPFSIDDFVRYLTSDVPVTVRRNPYCRRSTNGGIIDLEHDHLTRLLDLVTFFADL